MPIRRAILNGRNDLVEALLQTMESHAQVSLYKPLTGELSATALEPDPADASIAKDLVCRIVKWEANHLPNGSDLISLWADADVTYHVTCHPPSLQNLRLQNPLSRTLVSRTISSRTLASEFSFPELSHPLWALQGRAVVGTTYCAPHTTFQISGLTRTARRLFPVARTLNCRTLNYRVSIDHM